MANTKNLSDSIPPVDSVNNAQNQAISKHSQSIENNPTPKLLNLICKKCQSEVQDNFYFCPSCGKKLKEPPFRFSWTNVVGYLLFSLLLPPLGIFPGFKHLRLPNQKAKILGILYIIITILVSAIMIKVFYEFINNTNKMLNETYLIQDYIDNPSGSVENQAEQLYNLEQ